MSEQELLERITMNPKVMVGKPVIKGTRLTVDYILKLLAHGATVAEILEEYEGLTQEDIRACLLFASRSLENTTLFTKIPYSGIVGLWRREVMKQNLLIVEYNENILGGTPVFVGTRVPVRTLLDYLEAGDSLDDFLDDFPSVSYEALKPLMPEVHRALSQVKTGEVITVAM
jgi:uncharacterized protein (DUF433 family)